MTHIHLAVDRRYLMIGQDGHHSVLGRQTEPSDETLATATAGLDVLGMAGWCVLSEGRHGAPGDRLALLPIRRLHNPRRQLGPGCGGVRRAPCHSPRRLACQRDRTPSGRAAASP